MIINTLNTAVLLLLSYYLWEQLIAQRDHPPLLKSKKSFTRTHSLATLNVCSHCHLAGTGTGGGRICLRTTQRGTSSTFTLAVSSLLISVFVYRCVCITGPFFMRLNSPLPDIAKQATRGRTRQITTKYFNRADGQDFVLWPPQIGTTLWQRILEAPGKLTPTSGGVYDNCAVAVSSVSLMCGGWGWIIPQTI